MKRAKLIGVAALTAGLLAAPAAHSQNYGWNATENAAHMSGLHLDRKMLAGTLAQSPRSVRLDGSSVQGVYYDEVREVSLFGARSPILMEMARITPDGRYVKPRLMLGRHSDDLRYWMHSVGISAERCYMPMLRGRSSRAEHTGKISLAVLVSARCSFF